MTARQVHKVRGMLRNPTTTYGEICDVVGISDKQLFAIQYGLSHLTASKAARYWRRNLAMLPTADSINRHFKARVRAKLETGQ